VTKNLIIILNYASLPFLQLSQEMVRPWQVFTNLLTRAQLFIRRLLLHKSKCCFRLGAPLCNPLVLSILCEYHHKSYIVKKLDSLGYIFVADTISLTPTTVSLGYIFVADTISLTPTTVT